MPEGERVEVPDRAAWRAWLEANHGQREGVWAVTVKGADRTVTYADLVEEALCFGWVDSVGRAVDERRTSLWIAPRKPRSAWSKPNKDRVAALEAAGLMAPAGRAAVETAKANGMWTKLDDVERLVEPPDLVAALDAAPDARRHWDAFPRSAKRGILEWIGAAKRDETRAARIRTTADEAAENRRANQWRQPKGAS